MKYGTNVAVEIYPKFVCKGVLDVHFRCKILHRLCYICYFFMLRWDRVTEHLIENISSNIRMLAASFILFLIKGNPHPQNKNKR